MKTTGIVRRIDELGRVVIPKEIRKTMHIKEGEEMEVFVTDDSLVLKKYSPVKNILQLAEEYAEILYDNTGYTCVICDADEIIASKRESEYVGKRITKNLENCLRLRKSAYFRKSDGISVTPGAGYADIAIAPIIVDGEVVGGMVLIASGAMSRADNCVKLLEVGASFFAKQIE